MSQLQELLTYLDRLHAQLSELQRIAAAPADAPALADAVRARETGL